MEAGDGPVGIGGADVTLRMANGSSAGCHSALTRDRLAVNTGRVDIGDALPFLVPLLLLQVTLLLLGLWDLTRPERHVRGGSKVLWAIVVICVGVIGPLVYFTVGREDT